MPRDSSRRSSEGLSQAVGDLSKLRPRLGELGRHRGLSSAKVQHQRHQPLLDAVVQIAFDPAAGLVAGGDDPRTRSRKLTAALLQRLGHGVEASLQDANFGDAALWNPHAEVTMREPVGHGSSLSDRLDDRPR